jgi:hypothetical protein|tara:strand:- start:3087 stop:5822 length:2736 start_codon:yes stop_codon:yes gene_type:complete
MAARGVSRGAAAARSRAAVRLVILAGIVFGALTGLLSSHQKRQRALANDLADRYATTRESTARGVDAFVDATPSPSSSPPKAPLAPALEIRTSTPTSGTASEGARVYVPSGWAERHQTKSSARTNARKDGKCLPGAHAESDERTVNAIPRATASTCEAKETIPGLCDALAVLLPTAAAAADGERAVLLAFRDDDAKGPGAVHVAKNAIEKTGARAVVVVAKDDAEMRAARNADLPCAFAGENAKRAQFAVAAAILALGADVLLVSHEVVLRGANPLVNVPNERGADVEGVPHHASMLGQVVGMGDPAMGWSQYSQSMAMPHVLSSLVLMHATDESRRLAEWLATGNDNAVDADVALSDELLLPAHDERQRSGATFRVLPSKCFSSWKAGGAIAEAAKGFPGKPWYGDTYVSRAEDPNKILTTETFDSARGVVLRDGPIGDGDDNGNCAAIAPRDRRGPTPRALRYIAPPAGDFPVGCEAGLADLCKVVRKVAINRQVLVAVSNKNIFYMLGLYLDAVATANITNSIVVALDKDTAAWCRARGTPYYHRELTSLTGSTDNHATSGLKFRVLREFLSVGVSVLLSDVDIVWMRNPFGGSRKVVPSIKDDPERVHVDAPAIYGDSDVEGMTDGWDDVSAYGFEHAGAGGVPMRRIVARNSGLFYLAATKESLRMVSRLAERMSTERNTWDQTAYNEEQVWMWSSDRGAAGNGGPAPAGVSQRVMNYVCFENTKYLFRYMRYDKQLYDGAAGRSVRPVSVHVNYHPEKPQRMVTLIDQYIKGERDAISMWNWGEGTSFAKPCVARPKPEEEANLFGKSTFARRVTDRAAKVESGSWGGAKGLTFLKNGVLETPWGKGKWGVIPSSESDGEDRLFADFVSTQHMLQVASAGNDDATVEVRMTSTRCSDGQKVDVTL